MNITCADDEGARSTVIALAKQIGFEGVDADLGKLTCLAVAS
jgi:predicted dinucleotide-binding enzyme